MKKMNKKGFTLMEMLIVIAIIAILIAIAIPTFTAALEKSRQKTDLANARALKSLVVAQYMAADDADPVDVYGAIAGADASGKTFYLNKNGQELQLAQDANSMKVTAKWDGTSYEKTSGTTYYISCTFDSTCKMLSSVPDLGSAS